MAKPEYYAASSQGSAGPDTALIQTWLNGSRDPCTHFDPVTVDGRFGSDTAKAVQEFQLRNKTSATPASPSRAARRARRSRAPSASSTARARP